MTTVTSSALSSLLGERVNDIRRRIEAACRRSGRQPGDVTLVAVTKSAPAEVAALLPALGVLDLGESRPQELWRKAAVLPQEVRWHLVGHLQRNKVARTLPLVYLIHSVDSLRLLAALEEEAERRQKTVDVLLEVNASREPNKHGFAPEEVPGLVPELAKLRWVRVIGLMTMAALEADPQHCRPTFALVRQLRDRLRGELGPPHELEHLSMGMSNDFEVAIEEGATIVRIGTALFESLG
ncbi:MAG TPA: YggS family pyridoxal phosphate-dependent enzyme [Gemmataceae bacterium]|nr:YggS family pyridoxal phosphate-dependent enzyme [Gemmataceae bacterium]